MNLANQYLIEIKNDQDFWLFTDIIIDNSQNLQTHFVTLIILEEAIKVNKINII